MEVEEQKRKKREKEQEKELGGNTEYVYHKEYFISLIDGSVIGVE